MAPDPARDGFLRLIEAKANIGGRYVGLKRVGTNGGEGHFSLVFSATDRQTGRTVAIKVFRPDRLIETYRFQCFFFLSGSDFAGAIGWEPKCFGMVGY